MICSFLAAISRQFGDAGLGDVVTESEIVGSGSVRGSPLQPCLMYA